MLYTRRGDDGTSGLFGTKERFPKDSLIFEALGTMDELNSFIGFCAAKAKVEQGDDALVPRTLIKVQQDLFIVQAELAGADKHLTPAHVEALEACIAECETRIEKPTAFVIPGATELSAMIDVARATSRRAERRAIGANEVRLLADDSKRYLNRLSSLLYALARLTATESHIKEQNPTY